MTATATPRVRGDIVENLGLKKGKVLAASFNRGNLFYEVIPKSDPLSQVLDFLNVLPPACAFGYPDSSEDFLSCFCFYLFLCINKPAFQALIILLLMLLHGEAELKYIGILCNQGLLGDKGCRYT